MKLQTITLILGTLSSFVCIGMNLGNQNLVEKNLNTIKLLQKQINDLEYTLLMQQKATADEFNTLMEHGFQCPNVIRNTNKPSKVLAIVEQRRQIERTKQLERFMHNNYYIVYPSVYHPSDVRFNQVYYQVPYGYIAGNRC